MKIYVIVNYRYHNKEDYISDREIGFGNCAPEDTIACFSRGTFNFFGQCYESAKELGFEDLDAFVEDDRSRMECLADHIAIHFDPQDPDEEISVYFVKELELY